MFLRVCLQSRGDALYIDNYACLWRGVVTQVWDQGLTNSSGRMSASSDFHANGHIKIAFVFFLISELFVHVKSC